jgi:hypothetical protein
MGSECEARVRRLQQWCSCMKDVEDSLWLCQEVKDTAGLLMVE